MATVIGLGANPKTLDLKEELGLVVAEKEKVKKVEDAFKNGRRYWSIQN